MERNEFDVWFNGHRRVFPEVNVWLGKIPKEDRQGTALAWQQAMEGIALADAESATQAMLRGDLKKPFSCSDHPAAVIGFARRQRADRVGVDEPVRRWQDGEETYQCPLCRDEPGRLIVWHDQSMRCAVGRSKKKLGEPGTIYTMAVACTCQAGDQYAKVMARYSEDRYLITNGWEHREQEQQALREFAEALVKPQSHAEFDAFA